MKNKIYIDNCINILNNNDIFTDATELSQAIEKSKKIDKTFYYNKDYDIYFTYNSKKDIHYFYKGV